MLFANCGNLHSGSSCQPPDLAKGRTNGNQKARNVHRWKLPLLNIFPKVRLMEIIGWEASIVTLATHWWATIMLVSDVLEGLEGLSKTSHTGIEQNTCCPIIDAKWNMPQNKWKYLCSSFRLAIFEPWDEPQVGNHRLKCRNGAWSGQFPVCTGDDHDDDHDDDDDAVHALVAEPSCLWGTN